MVTRYNFCIFPAQTEPDLKPENDLWAMREAYSSLTVFGPNPEHLHNIMVKKYGEDVPAWDTINQKHDENGNPYYKVEFQVIQD